MFIKGKGMRETLGAGYDFIKVNDKYWFAHAKYNALCSVDENDEVSDVVVFPGYNYINEDKALFGKILSYSKYIVCVPFAAEDIAVYDIENRCFNMIRLKNCGIDEEINQAKFNSVLKINNYLYMFGCTYTGIVRLNLDTFDVEYDFEIIKLIDEIDGTRANNWYFTDAVRCDDSTILLTVGQLPIIVELDTETNTTKIHRIRCSMSGFWGIKKVETKLYIIGIGAKSGNVIVWDYEAGKTSEIKVKNDIGFDVPYSHIFMCSEKIYLLPFDEKYLYSIDTNSGEVKIDDITKEMYRIMDENGNTATTLAARLLDDKLVFVTADDYSWHKYNLKKECLKSASIRITDRQYIREIIRYICERNIANQGYVREEYIDLDGFIDYLECL